MMDFSLTTYKDEITDVLQRFIRIPSVKAEPQSNMPYGRNVFDALLFILNQAERLDFDSVNMYSHLGYIEYGDGDETLVILTHIDVVPAGDGWTHEPFGGEIENGRIYGRGAVDDKGAAVIALYALHAIKENCKILNKKVRLIFGCDEESGWSDMDFYKTQEPEEPAMAISPDANFPVINFEKGLLHIELKKKTEKTCSGNLYVKSFHSGDRVNIVPREAVCEMAGDSALIAEAAGLFFEGLPVKYACEKTEKGAKITVFGKASHGSKPGDGVNAAAYLCMFLNTLPLYKSKTDAGIYSIAEKLGLETDGKTLGIAASDELGDVTVNLGTLHTGDGEMSFMLDIRYLKDMKKEDILEAVKAAFPDFEAEIKHDLPAHYVDVDSPLIKGLFSAYEEITGEKGYGIAIGGATYAKVFKNSVAFGPLFPWQESCEHQADEYIDIASLITAGDVLANAIMKLCE